MNIYVYPVAIAFVMFASYKFYDLTKENELLKTKLMLSKMQNKSCMSSLATQNDKVSVYKIDLEEREEALRVWKNKPEKVRYEVIYKDII